MEENRDVPLLVRSDRAADFRAGRTLLRKDDICPVSLNRQKSYLTIPLAPFQAKVSTHLYLSSEKLKTARKCFSGRRFQVGGLSPKGRVDVLVDRSAKNVFWRGLVGWRRPDRSEIGRLPKKACSAFPGVPWSNIFV